jgi:signal transduction histidine kinase
MLLLAGHALHSPLSVIRWGCARLKKTPGMALSSQQQRVIDGIQQEARLLSRIIDVLLVTSRVQQQLQKMHPKEMQLQSVLAATLTPELLSGRDIAITCPAQLMVFADDAVAESLLTSLGLLLVTAATHSQPLRLEVSQEGEVCEVRAFPPLQFSVLRDPSLLSDDTDTGELVGGVPGLMLSLLPVLSLALGWTFDVREHGPTQHVLSLRIPVREHAVSPA